jgi:murein DD-endopeptidase MepM/ murein hydrolase activator NlpD
MVCATLTHFKRRALFTLKADRLIITRVALPAISQNAKAKADEGYNSAFIRKFRTGAREVHVGTRKLAKKAGPHVRANALAISIGTAAICGILLISTIMTGDITYYEYSYGGKVLGVVKDESEVYQTVSRPETKKTIDEQAGAPVILDEDSDIAVKKVIKLTPTDVSVDDEDAIITNIATLNDVNVTGCAITSNGETIGTVGSAKAANELLDRVTERWLEGKAQKEYKEVSFTSEVTRAAIETKKINVESVDEIMERLAATSFSAIGVKTVETERYEEEYKAKPIYIDKKNRYKDYKLEVTPGATGLRDVTADIVRVNGELVEKVPTSYDVVHPATPAHIIRGTKKLPKPIGKGIFVRPVESGPMTSHFGPRWGRMHKGIDIGIKYAPVYAANDGIIVYTGNKGDGYGIKVVIKHDDVYETLYGHLSKTLVNVGDKVYKGQHIATSGNTGDSTGPHLHFEVHVNGVAHNPLYYM